MHFLEIPTALFQRPWGLTSQNPAFYEHININTKTEAWINTTVMPADKLLSGLVSLMERTVVYIAC